MFVVVATAGGVGFGGLWLWQGERLRASLADVQVDVQQGRHALANRKLVDLLKRQPDCPEALYLLGVCQKAQGKFDLSFQTWGRLRPGTPFTVPAILERSLMLATAGRLADAERLTTNALADPRIEPAGLRWFLVPFYGREGRPQEAKRLIKANWDELDFTREGTLDQAVKLVRMHLEGSLRPPSIQEIRGFLEQAGARAPDDDRVWLGKANLAIRSGALDEAESWINACLKRRPDDAPVWRARLNWAIAAGKLPEAETAMAHLPVGSVTPILIPALQAWFAAHHGDLVAEKRALKTLLAADPDQPAVIERLAVLGASPTKSPNETELETLKARCRRLFDRNQPGRDAPELARIAEQLGHWFEARAFWTIAQATGWPVADLPATIARLKARENLRRTESLTGSLADQLAPVFAGNPTSGSIADAHASVEAILSN